VIIGSILIAISILFFGAMTTFAAVEVVPSDNSWWFKVFLLGWLLLLTVIASGLLFGSGVECLGAARVVARLS